MKRLSILLILLITSIINCFSQDSTFIKVNKWLADNNFSIRKTFDGSKNENKPSGISFQENHKTSNDFFNIDIGVKLSEFELKSNKSSVFIFYPKIEWHKSTDSIDKKNKLDGGFNFEFIPFGLKSPNLPSGIPNNGLKLAPWFQGTSAYKRNFLDNVFETKLSLQLSLVSNYKWFPGCTIRDKKSNFRFRYYPYLGIEFNSIPDLILKGQLEEFSTYFVRLFAETWIIPQTLQINIDGTYREIIKNNSTLKTAIPILSTSIYLYPGKQESLGIGYEYKHGYDTDSKFQLVKISSLKLSWKI